MYFYYLLSNGFLFHFFSALYLWSDDEYLYRVSILTKIKLICERLLIYNPFVKKTHFYCIFCVYVCVWVPFKTYSSKLGNWKSLYFFLLFCWWVQTYTFHKTTFVHSYLLFKFITNTRFSSTVYSKGVQIKFLSGNQIKIWLRREFLHA